MSCPCTHCVYACRPEKEMDGESHPILHDHPKKSRIQSHTPHTLAPLTKNIFEGQTIIIMKLLSALLLSFSVLLGTFHLGKTTTVVLAQEDQQDRHLRWFHRKKKEAPKKKKHDYKPPHYMDVQNVVRVWAENKINPEDYTNDEAAFIAQALKDSYNQAYHHEDPEDDLHATTSNLMSYGNDFMSSTASTATSSSTSDFMPSFWRSYDYTVGYWVFMISYHCRFCTGLYDDDDIEDPWGGDKFAPPKTYDWSKKFPHCKEEGWCRRRMSLIEGPGLLQQHQDFPYLAQMNQNLLNTPKEPWEALLCEMLNNSGYEGFKNAKNCKIAMDPVLAPVVVNVLSLETTSPDDEVSDKM